MARVNGWLKGTGTSMVTREVEIGPSGLGSRDGHVRETFTFYANRFSRRQFERKLAEAADEFEVHCQIEVKPGLLLCDIGVAVEGEQDQVDRFRRYAVGLSAASDGDFGGAGGP